MCLVRACLLCVFALLSTAGFNPRITYTNPVLDGNFPDPSIIRVGTEYWATTTQTDSNSSGIFPLFHSSDLAHWQQQGSVFKTPPAWTDGNPHRFWAPEISHPEHGKFYVFYAASCRQGEAACSILRDPVHGHCIGVAIAPAPGGDYKDLGKPLHCDALGSIDPMAYWDGSKAYLLWKEDSNSCEGCRVPSRIWAQELARDGKSLVDPASKTELLESQERLWEHHVVEGPFLLHHGGYYYLFYSGARFGGVGSCDYGVGVARSRALLGPYIKDPANPIETRNKSWTCPGHGSIVETPRGQFFFLHHAYPLRPERRDIREAVLDEIVWQPNGWPVINNDLGVSSTGSIR